jgi:hypothetical protein
MSPEIRGSEHAAASAFEFLVPICGSRSPTIHGCTTVFDSWSDRGRSPSAGQPHDQNNTASRAHARGRLKTAREELGLGGASPLWQPGLAETLDYTTVLHKKNGIVGELFI